MNTLDLVNDCKKKFESLEKNIPIKEHSHRIAEIDELMSAPGAWADNKKGASLLKERQSLSDIINQITKMGLDIEMLQEYLSVYPEEEETLAPQVTELAGAIDAFELSQTLTGPHDAGNAIVTITAGSGGSESKQWGAMLMRMYFRYADRNGWKIEIFDEKWSEEHSNECLDSVTFQVSGTNAYGYLKGENGVMRLIRVSPFSSNGARHTSFAAVNVVPEVDDKIEIVIRDEDVELSTMTAGGAGGQHQNRTRSAVRLLHTPSGVSVYCRAERSQHENRRIALKLLQSKLFEIDLKKKNAEKDQALENQSDAAFGAQIRSYTLSPFKLVKDHRSKFESSQAEKILDGDLQELIRSNLLFR